MESAWKNVAEFVKDRFLLEMIATSRNLLRSLKRDFIKTKSLD